MTSQKQHSSTPHLKVAQCNLLYLGTYFTAAAPGPAKRLIRFVSLELAIQPINAPRSKLCRTGSLENFHPPRLKKKRSAVPNRQPVIADEEKKRRLGFPAATTRLAAK